MGRLIYYCRLYLVFFSRGLMIKKIDVTGIQLDNYTVREAIMKIETEYEKGGLFSIGEVDTDVILMAGTDENVKRAVESLRLTVIAEAGILKAVGQANMQRIYEIEQNTFFFEFMKRTERNHKQVYLLGNTKEQTDSAMKFIQKEFPRISFVGVGILDECAGEPDGLVNEINASTPDVLLCILPSPMQENFFVQHKDKLGIRIWYGIGNHLLQKKKRRLWNYFTAKLRERTLSRHILSYDRQNEVKNENKI